MPAEVDTVLALQRLEQRVRQLLEANPEWTRAMARGQALLEEDAREQEALALQAIWLVGPDSPE